MAKISKILFTLIVSLLVISCSAITSEQYFEKGEYINSLRTINVELSKIKNQDDKTVLLNRINSIIEIYENNYNNASTNYSIAESSFNLFKLLYTIESNNLISNYTNIQRKYSTVEVLEKAVNYTKLYSNENESINSLTTLLNKMKNENLRESQYVGTYQSFSKYVADKYYDLAIYYENRNDLKNALENYKNSQNSYIDFDVNYRNSKNKIYEIQKSIDLKTADELVKRAGEEYIILNLEKSISLYKEAISIYSKYGLYQKSNIYVAIVERIQREIELASAKKYYNNAIYYYNLKDYEKAEKEFKNAYKIYNKYSDNNMKSLINGYLEIISFKLKEEKAKYYYDKAVSYYNSAMYSEAKANFIKAKELYTLFSNHEMLNKVELYLKAIDGHIYIKNDNNGEELLRRAKSNLDKAVYEKNEILVKKYYQDALTDLNTIINYNLLPNKIDEVKSYIRYINRSNNVSPDNLLYNKYYKKGLELKKEAEKYVEVEKTNYYYTLAYKNLEKALEYAQTIKEREEISNHMKLIKKYIVVPKIDSIVYNEYYNAAMKNISDANSEWSISNRDSLFKSAIKNLKEAQKYTDDFSLIIKIDSMIKEIEKKITFKF